jgi:hypothetical protein
MFPGIGGPEVIEPHCTTCGGDYPGCGRNVVNITGGVGPIYGHYTKGTIDHQRPRALGNDRLNVDDWNCGVVWQNGWKSLCRVHGNYLRADAYRYVWIWTPAAREFGGPRTGVLLPQGTRLVSFLCQAYACGDRLF